MESILTKKKDSLSRINPGPDGQPQAVGDMALMSLKTSDLDDYIKRLIDAGYAGACELSMLLYSIFAKADMLTPESR